jgi:putative membrane protein
MTAATPPPQQLIPGATPSPPGADVVPVKQTERPHPLTPLIRGWLVFVAIAIGWGRQLIPNGDNTDRVGVGDLRWILPVVGGIVLLAAAAGFVTWYFTRFVIDDDELRIETGAIFKNSKRIPFERLQSVDVIQPFAARIFGLAELRLEAGAGDSTTKLRYLSRAKATRLRDYLLTRAHGQRASLNDPDQTGRANAFTDLTAADRPLVTVTAQRLIVGFLLSSEWLTSAAVAIIVLVVTSAFNVVGYALTGLIPLIVGAVSLIGRRLIAMFNFTLSESPRGLRVTRGLANLTSQSVPVNRIQGVKVSQPLLWRPLGWYRVDVDILGYGRSDGENNESNATSVLLPVADGDQVTLAVAQVLPEVDLTAVELSAPPRRARWIRWFDFWTLRYGWDERTLITEHGWLTHVRDIVPHAKTQSVRIEQGPLQRLLRLADVHIDTPKGPVNAVAHQLDAAKARELALSQLDRARVARAADRHRRPAEAVTQDDRTGEVEVLAGFGITPAQLLGIGGESEVFALDEHRVLRLYRRAHEASEPTIVHLRGLYQGWQHVDIGVELPLILDVGDRAGRSFSVDRRFSGRPFSGWLAEAEPEQRRAALLTFLDATERLRRLPSPLAGFARLVGARAPAQFDTLVGLLDDMLRGPVTESWTQLSRDLPDVAAAWSRLHADLAQREVSPVLVHGDICPPNAYLSMGPTGPVVTGIGDFSPHTVHGDPLMDIAGAVAFLELEGYQGAAEDSRWLRTVAETRWGGGIGHWMDVYRRFYAFYFSNSAEFDPRLYAWCLRQLAGSGADPSRDLSGDHRRRIVGGKKGGEARGDRRI